MPHIPSLKKPAKTDKTPTLTLFGYGRFGKLLYELLENTFSIRIYDPEQQALSNASLPFVTLDEALSSETLLYAVPIDVFENTIAEHSALLEKDTTPKLFIDVLSVKMLSEQVFTKYLASHHSCLLTHPMFGPDSVAEAGIQGQRLVLYPLKIAEKEYARWRTLFSEIGLHVVEMSAEQHDRLAARSQGLAHFIGRVLENFGLTETPIDTLGAKQLLALKQQTCNDSWELFSGLQTKNPFTIEMRTDLGRALDTIYDRLLPKQVKKDRLTVGIQGGKGSFNEEAARYYLERAKISHFDLVYLYTTPNVLEALHQGRIDCGQFAIHNSVGGIVEESLWAMAKYKFHIEEEFAITIEHSLMKRKDTPLSQIDAIMTHPQVIKQCRKNLEAKYPRLKLTSGEGDLVDSARAGAALAKGDLPKTYAVMGSKVIADLYDLDLVETGLQDASENFTSFLWVTR